LSVESVKKWVNITQVGLSPSGKTKVWHVTGKDGPNDGIGEIKWHGAWRKYVYYSDEAFYDWDCLRLIAEFCETATRDHCASS
jgi:hypothetical protein